MQPQAPMSTPSLPHEVLLNIFTYTQPPLYRYDPFIGHGPRNPWLQTLRTKKALVLVCRLWSAPATELLYSDIVLRRMGQISALANTLRSDEKQTLARLVRAIRVDSCVVLTHCADVVREDFEFLLSQCTALLSFAFRPHPSPGFGCSHGPAAGQLPLEYDAAFNPNWILDCGSGRAGSLLAQRLASRMHSFHCGLAIDDRQLGSLVHILSCASHLTSLSLGKVPPARHCLLPVSGPSSPLPNLVFPALATLSIHCDHDSNPSFIDYIRTQWTMPRLASLTLSYPPLSFLAAHGSKLSYLNAGYLIGATELLARLHELCPSIVHLVVAGPTQNPEVLDINSPTLRYLDLFRFDPHTSISIYRSLALSETTRAPQLRKVRMLSDLAVPYADLCCHPELLPGSQRPIEDVSGEPGAHESDELADWFLHTSGGIVHTLPDGLRLRQHSWALVHDAVVPRENIRDPRIPVGDEADSEDEDEFQCGDPSILVSQHPDSEGADTESEADDDVEEDHAPEELDSGSDSDMTRATLQRWDPRTFTWSFPGSFVDDPLDSSRGQYDRTAILQRFSQSQLGDYLLD